MSLELVTGYAGASHVSSADMGAFNAGIVGTGRYVLPVGSRFELGWSADSTTLVLRDGDAVDQGRHMRIPNGDTEIITLSNGASGMLRADIICLQYTLDAATGIESAAVVVVEGTPGSNYTDPTLDQGNILEGDDHDLMPLYRVKISNYSIAGVDTLFSMYEGNGDLGDKVNSFSEISTNTYTLSCGLELTFTKIGRIVWLSAAGTIGSLAANTDQTFTIDSKYTPYGGVVRDGGSLGEDEIFLQRYLSVNGIAGSFRVKSTITSAKYPRFNITYISAS